MQTIGNGKKRIQIVDSNNTPWELEQNAAMPINIQDQHSLALDLDFIQSQGATTLAADANIEDLTLTLTSAAGFIAGNVIGLFNPSGIFYFGTQIGAAVGNVITLDTPIDKTFLSADSNVIRATKDMNVDGSITTQIFQIGPVGGTSQVEIDITRFSGYMQSAGAMDDAKFGDIAGGLTNGIVLRANNGAISNIWNAKTNGRLALITATDLRYTDRAPAGSEGARFRNSYAGQEKHGVTIRLAPGDILQLLIRDNLTTLEAFNMMAQGHVVVD